MGSLGPHAQNTPIDCSSPDSRSESRLSSDAAYALSGKFQHSWYYDGVYGHLFARDLFCYGQTGKVAEITTLKLPVFKFNIVQCLFSYVIFYLPDLFINLTLWRSERLGQRRIICQNCHQINYAKRVKKFEIKGQYKIWKMWNFINTCGMHWRLYCVSWACLVAPMGLAGWIKNCIPASSYLRDSSLLKTFGIGFNGLNHFHHFACSRQFCLTDSEKKKNI